MGRTWAIVEREMRRFRRSPVLIAMSMMMPIVQLVVLGYAFGGNVKHLKLAIVDHGKLVALDTPARLKASIPGASEKTTLDDVFVHYAGRDLRDALQAPAAADSPFMIRR